MNDKTSTAQPIGRIMLKTIDELVHQAANLTDAQTRSLGFAWRRQYGGMYAGMWARKAAVEAGRRDVLEHLRAPAREVNELDSKLGDTGLWDRACARVAAAEAVLALSVADLATTETERRHVNTLLAPWRHVFGTDSVPVTT